MTKAAQNMFLFLAAFRLIAWVGIYVVYIVSTGAIPEEEMMTYISLAVLPIGLWYLAAFVSGRNWIVALCLIVEIPFSFMIASLALVAGAMVLPLLAKVESIGGAAILLLALMLRWFWPKKEPETSSP